VAFDVASLEARITIDTSEAERGLQRFSQQLNQLGRQDAAEAAHWFHHAG
jgi:hypothetical protein